MKDIITTTLVIGAIALAILTYPFFVKVENGETICSNALGQTVKCR